MRVGAQLLLTFVLNAVWQIALVAAIAQSCVRLLRWTPARVRHSIWVIALTVSVLWPLTNSIALAKRLIYENDSKMAAANFVANQQMIKEFTQLEASAPAVQPPQKSSPIRLTSFAAGIILALYTLFLVHASLKLFRAWRKTRSIVGSVSSIEGCDWIHSLVIDCQKRTNVRRMRIASSAIVPVPMTAGVFNPLVILPEYLLAERDQNVLASAVGHEMVHVARHDYILNLAYELLYLVVAFHPAAALLRRRIKQTRELCCDEQVARKLIEPEIYARSLVRLIGSVSLTRQLPANTTIGITEADILEVRIMSLLKNSKLSKGHRVLSLGATLLFLVPCVAAASFAINLDIDHESAVRQQDKGSADQTRARQAELEKAREHLQQKQEQLRELVRNSPNMKGAQLEELQRMEQDVAVTAAKLRQYEVEHQRVSQERLKEMQQILQAYEQQRPRKEDQIRELRNRYNEIVTQYPRQGEQLAVLQQQLHEQEKQLKEKSDRQEKLKMKERRSESEDIERAERDEDVRERSKERSESEDLERTEQDVERSEISRRQAELTKLATVSMDRAIQVAVGRYPGKVVSCSLGRSKDGQAHYRVIIINMEGEKTTSRHVWVNAGDGQIIKTEQED